MKNSASLHWAVVLFCGLAGTASAAPQDPQTAPPATQNPPAVSRPAESQPVEKTKHISVGLRVRVLPARSLSVMDSQTQLTTTTPVVVRDWNFNTTSHSPVWGVGPAVEIAVNPNFTVSAELIFNRISYTKVTNIYWGTDDPATTTDERTHMVRNENTRGRLFDFPLLLHYRGLWKSGALSRMYLAGGAAVRTVTNIKTNNTTTFPNASTISDINPASPSRRYIVGAVVGVGFRVVDDFHMKTTPEIRYTRWGGSTFGQDSTQSPRNQLEIGLGFTF